MNEPLLKKAKQIISKNGSKSFFGGVKFHSQDAVIRSMIEFAKFYDKFERETDEEKKQDGSDFSKPKCIICGEDYFTRCLCLKINI
jgi:hypothetical protein